MNQRLKKIIDNKRIIFTLTSARSGTKYLSRVLNLLPDVVAVHEPMPSFSYPFRRSMIRGEEFRKVFWERAKLPSIASYNGKIYIETSHLFIEGFIESLNESGIVPDIIILNRDERQVALSLYRLNDIPGSSARTNGYYLKPDDPIAMTTVERWEELSPYQKCFWYTQEIKRRKLFYKTLLSSRGSRIIEIDVMDIRNRSKLTQFLLDFNLPVFGHDGSKVYERIKKRRFNTKLGRKRPLSVPEGIGRQENQVLRWIRYKDGQ